ncbi:MAG: DUF2063 domain-containing protein [Polyangiaceae bacterium]
MQAPLETAMAELCFGAEVDPRDDEAVRAWLDAHGVSDEDRDYLLAANRERLFVYRSLVRGTLWEALHASIPRTMARLGGVFEEYFDAFLKDAGPRTHYLRDAIAEFLTYAAPLWLNDPRVPAYIPELARHEHSQILVGSMLARDPAVQPEALELDAGLCFIEAVKLMHYDHAVHELTDSEADRTPPVARPTHLLVYRNPEHEVRYLELSPLAARIVEATLEERCSLRDALTHSCEELGTELDDTVLSGTAHLLADLAERGVLLGPARD